ncbi:MAG: sugar phosphate isomerase/epimerase family protein [Chloroflexota bacterium]
MTQLPFTLYLHSYSLRFHLRHVPGFDALALIDLAADHGFDGVCLSANGPNYRDLGSMEPARFAQIRARLEQRGLLCDLDTSGTDPDHLRTLLGVAQAVGAQKLRTYTRYDAEPEAQVEWTIRDLTAVSPHAAAHNITIMLENHEKMTGAEIARILTAVNHPHIAALYDYGNSMMVLEDPLDALTHMAPWSRSAHLKDHVMIRPQDGENGRLTVLGVPIGTGYLPIVDITRRLLTAGCTNIVFENSWGYSAPIQPDRITAVGLNQLGCGSFRFAAPPFHDNHALLNPDDLSPEQLVTIERTIFEQNLAWVRKQLSVIGKQ